MPPPLTEQQKNRLSTLEPALRRAAQNGDYEAAKMIALDVQQVLRISGHETRLMQAKNWLFEAAMEAGSLDIAIPGFIGIREKTAHTTRVHLEATALLAICYLRQQKPEKAEPLMHEVLTSDTNIKSESRRKQFVRRVVARFHEEAALSSLRNSGNDGLDPAEIQDHAGKLVQLLTEDEIYAELARALPPGTAALLIKVDQLAKKGLTEKDIKYLPTTKQLIEDQRLGSTVFSSIKRVLYRSLCDKDSEIYQAWFNRGFAVVLDKKYFAAAVAATLVNMGAGVKALAVSVTALLIKFGIEVYCARFKPEGVMIDRNDKS
jgi:hypothetical protein